MSPSAGCLVCQGVERSNSDSVEGERHGGRSSQARATHAEKYERGAVFQLPRKDVLCAVPPNVTCRSRTGGVRGGGTEFEIMTRNLFSSWAQLRKLSSAVIFVDIRKPLYSVLVEEVVGPVMVRSDRAKVMARIGWTESEKHQLEATLQGRQQETALVGMAPDVAAMLADWRQTNWFTVQGAEKRALHAT